VLFAGLKVPVVGASEDDAFVAHVSTLVRGLPPVFLVHGTLTVISEVQ
jgi:hypothetical protein